jgi:2-polyprenyl-3-methyl-5-hydroxy-6-metoxy-1,4-benzoquinol methylase
MDLFGTALNDHFHDRSKGPLMVCADEFEEPLDVGFYFSETPEEFELEMFKYLKGRILDVGCGAGRILGYLQKQGFDASGFDISPLAIRTCDERGIAKARIGSHDDDDQGGIYDTILFMNRTVGTAGSLEGVEALLKRCRSWCAPDGVLIFDSLEVRPEKANAGPGLWRHVLHFRYGGVVGDEWPYVHFGAGIAEGLLRKTGWRRLHTVTSGDRYAMVCGK